MYESLNFELDQLKQKNLYRNLKKIDQREGPRIKIKNRWLIDFSSNDYLGLSQNTLISQSIIDGLKKYGNGACASHLISGHFCVHDELEKISAKNIGLEKSLYFTSGYLANLSLMTSIAQKDHHIFMDRLNHASLNQGALYSKAKFSRFRHLDYKHLESLLKKKSALTRWIVTDGIFSMDGDMAYIPELLRLCKKFDAYLYIDDAHGFGLLGSSGQGIIEHFLEKKLIAKEDLKRVIYLYTLGKSAGVSGALLNGKREIIDFMIQKAKPYIYSTATSPAIIEGLITSLTIIKKTPELRKKLNELIFFFRSTFKHKERMKNSNTAIQPIIIGSEKEVLEISSILEQEGFFVPAIRPPTVEAGLSRLRVSISAIHNESEIAKLINVLNKVLT